MIIYSMGILDIGRNETWEILESLLFENFHRFKKIDFDFALSGFNSGATKKGSTKLMKLFIACVKQNYASEGNIQHEDFILAATSIAKDRDRNLGDKQFWELAVTVLMDFINIEKSKPSLAALCLKIIS
jgi:hypothetical protein